MTKFLKPAEGRTVDQVDGTPWPAGGMDADDTLFVRRRIADGDLVEATPEDAKPDQDEPADASKPKTRK